MASTYIFQFYLKINVRNGKTDIIFKTCYNIKHSMTSIKLCLKIKLDYITDNIENMALYNIYV